MWKKSIDNISPLNGSLSLGVFIPYDTNYKLLLTSVIVVTLGHC